MNFFSLQFWGADAAAASLPATVQRRVGSSDPQTLSVPAEEDQNSTGGNPAFTEHLSPENLGCFHT